MNDVVVKQQVLTIYSPTVVTKALHENKADPEYRSAFDKECWGIVVWMVLKQDMGETLGFFDGRTSVGRCGCVARNEAHYTAPGHDGRYNEYRTGTLHGKYGGREDLSHGCSGVLESNDARGHS